MNQVMLVGRLGADPEYRAFKDGEDGVVNFSLATDRKPAETSGSTKRDSMLPDSP